MLPKREVRHCVIVVTGLAPLDPHCNPCRGAQVEEFCYSVDILTKYCKTKAKLSTRRGRGDKTFLFGSEGRQCSLGQTFTIRRFLRGRAYMASIIRGKWHLREKFSNTFRKISATVRQDEKPDFKKLWDQMCLKIHWHHFWRPRMGTQMQMWMWRK